MTTSTKTEQELVIQVAYNLNVLGENQTMVTDTSTTIQGFVGPTLLSLSARNIIDLPNENAIPTEAFLDLARCVADAAASTFGKDNDPAMVMFSEDNLHKISRYTPLYDPELRMDKALQRPRGLNLVRWQGG